MAELDWGDVQGTVLRGYRVDLARHFVLEVQDPNEARGLLGSLVEAERGGLHVTTAARWRDKPESSLNVGITFEGLRALGLPDEHLGSFPEALPAGCHPPSQRHVGRRRRRKRSSALDRRHFGYREASPNRWSGGRRR